MDADNALHISIQNDNLFCLKVTAKLWAIDAKTSAIIDLDTQKKWVKKSQCKMTILRKR